MHARFGLTFGFVLLALSSTGGGQVLRGLHKKSGYHDADLRSVGGALSLLNNSRTVAPSPIPAPSPALSLPTAPSPIAAQSPPPLLLLPSHAPSPIPAAAPSLGAPASSKPQSAVSAVAPEAGTAASASKLTTKAAAMPLASPKGNANAAALAAAAAAQSALVKATETLREAKALAAAAAAAAAAGALKGAAAGNKSAANGQIMALATSLAAAAKVEAESAAVSSGAAVQKAPANKNATGTAAMRNVVTAPAKRANVAETSKGSATSAVASPVLNGTSDLEELRHATALAGVVAASTGNSSALLHSTRSPSPRASDVVRTGAPSDLESIRHAQALAEALAMVAEAKKTAAAAGGNTTISAAAGLKSGDTAALGMAAAIKPKEVTQHAKQTQALANALAEVAKVKEALLAKSPQTQAMKRTHTPASAKHASNTTDSVLAAEAAAAEAVARAKAAEAKAEAAKAVARAAAVVAAAHTGTRVKRNPPSMPLLVRSTAGDGQATVKWKVPANAGDGAITEYRVSYEAHAKLKVVKVLGAEGSAPATAAIIGGLRNGASFTFRVQARNKFGLSPKSLPTSCTPYHSSDLCAQVSCSGHGSCFPNYNIMRGVCVCRVGYGDAEDCSTRNTGEVYGWSVGPWSACSAECGSGLKKRSVRCTSFDDDGFAERTSAKSTKKTGCVTSEARPAEFSRCNTLRCSEFKGRATLVIKKPYSDISFSAVAISSFEIGLVQEIATALDQPMSRFAVINHEAKVGSTSIVLDILPEHRPGSGTFDAEVPGARAKTVFNTSASVDPAAVFVPVEAVLRNLTVQAQTPSSFLRSYGSFVRLASSCTGRIVRHSSDLCKHVDCGKYGMCVPDYGHGMHDTFGHMLARHAHESKDAASNVLSNSRGEVEDGEDPEKALQYQMRLSGGLPAVPDLTDGKPVCVCAPGYDPADHCRTPTKDATADWVAGPWSVCSRGCGGGTRTRSVTCAVFKRGTPLEPPLLSTRRCVHQSARTGMPQPADSQKCNQFACGRQYATAILVLKRDLKLVPRSRAAKTAFVESFLAEVAAALRADERRFRFVSIGERPSRRHGTKVTIDILPAPRPPTRSHSKAAAAHEAALQRAESTGDTEDETESETEDEVKSNGGSEGVLSGALRIARAKTETKKGTAVAEIRARPRSAKRLLSDLQQQVNNATSALRRTGTWGRLIDREASKGFLSVGTNVVLPGDTPGLDSRHHHGKMSIRVLFSTIVVLVAVIWAVITAIGRVRHNGSTSGSGNKGLVPMSILSSSSHKD